MTGAQIKLPPSPEDFEKPQYLRVSTSTNPSDPNCMILARTTADSHKAKLTICRPGDAWGTYVLGFYRFCSDTIFYEGEFYAIDFSCHIHRIIWIGTSFQAENLSIQPPKQSFVDNYVVVLKGKLSPVLICKNSTAADKFNVYNLDWRRNKWIKVENIGYNVVGLGKNCSKTDAADGRFAVNSIYFIDDAGKNLSKPLTCGVGVYNIATKHCESLKRYFGLCALSWFKPEL